ncbi:DNA helicase RecQ [Limnoglobus roseus]|uniref:DNA helicase RecQ n=1 Tax=Limnoglobus roseus TaxID=2598579 RepID=A0A5C1A989_9BACT|nr:DNA helicase RecQ [Limnoglobus roseus]QEL13638.1 DNA helicase RecQ [Limnoglobus roseus]
MPTDLPPDLLAAVANHWGFRALRPLQTEAIRAVLNRRDSMVVMPTGGGKSLCYQAPALVRDGLTVVVSPLIALMKDQVDGLTRNGISAVRLDSTLTASERTEATAAIRSGQTRLVFVSPERLVNTGTAQLLREAGAHTVAIDEAHCISHWGHDFRPEYRMLARLREFFPGSSIHAYTATATEQVRNDIIAQLNLKKPEVLVGNFDRPNLTYRVLPQVDMISQIRDVLDRHKDEAGIVYCLRRADVDTVSQTLKRAKYRVVPYHAGMTAEQRKQSHDAFASEEADIVVATIAFGMGIDRSNVRFVIHACVPKTIEHYQQETGRAGRDGLPSECLLLFSIADVVALKRIMEKSATEANVGPEIVAGAKKQLDQMTHYASGATCRHKALVQHFGQQYDTPNCGACDICLGDTQDVPDAQVIAQKILSCVARVGESFGVNHVIDVLRGADTEAVRSRGHNALSTYGLLKEMAKPQIRDHVFQLLGQDVLAQSDGEYPVLKLTPASWAVMKGQKTVRLIQLKKAATEATAAGKTEKGTLPAGSDPELFELLRQLRRQHAARLSVPPYQIFADTILAELARCRPTTFERMRQVSGIGDVKLREFGTPFLNAIVNHSQAHKLSTDLPPPRESTSPPAAAPSAKPNTTKQLSFSLFRDGSSLEDVIHQTKLTRPTVCDHLADFIRQEKPESVLAWVSEDVCERVAAAAEQHGTARLKPVYLALNEEVNYDAIRVVFAFLDSQRGA